MPKSKQDLCVITSSNLERSSRRKGSTAPNTLTIPFSYYTVSHLAFGERKRRDSLACFCCSHSFPAFSFSERPPFPSSVVEMSVNESKSLSSSPAIAWLDWTSLRSSSAAIRLLDEGYGRDKLLAFILSVLNHVAA